MALESASYLNDLVTSNPVGSTDSKSEGDDHLRLLKSVLKATFPNLAGRTGRIQGKTASYNAVANDNTSVIVFTAGTTPTLGTAVAASSLGNGWNILCINVSGSTVTIDPNGSETVNGGATQDIDDDYVAFIWCDGSNFYAIVLPLVPPAAIATNVPTGAMLPYCGATAPSGFVLAAGNTIGDASSGADRANADTENLFALLWDSYANTELALLDSSGSPVSRGGSAASDYAAHCRLPVPDLRGRQWLVKDDLGGSAANRVTNAVSGVTATTLGAAGGDQHAHHATIQITDPGHTHSLNNVYSVAPPNSSLNGAAAAFFNVNTATGSSTTGITAADTNTGASQNMSPVIVGGAIIKL